MPRRLSCWLKPSGVVLAGFGLVMLSGCATGAKKPDMSVFDLAHDVVLTSVPLAGVAIHAALGKPTVETGGGFKSAKQNFCQTSGGSLVQAREQFADLCRVKGATFDGAFCRRGDGDDVIFMARIVSTGSGGCFTLKVAEPVEPSGSSEYLAHLVSNGYVSEAARRQNAAVRAADAARRADLARLQVEAKSEADQRRLLAELPQMKKRGTVVCTDDGRQTWVGYVEDSTDEKLKVLVSSGYLTQAPQVALRVDPGTLRWDDFATWRLCR